MANLGDKQAKVEVAAKTNLDLFNNKLLFKDLIKLTSGDCDSEGNVQHNALVQSQFLSPVALIVSLLQESLSEIAGDSEQDVL